MRFARPSALVLTLLCAMYALTYIDRVNVSTAAAGFGREFHLSRTEIGLVFSAFAYPYLVFQVVGGWVSDRFGTRWTLIVCALVWSGATWLTGLAGGLYTLLGARLLLGLGEGATFPAATAVMSRWVPKDKRGLAQGLTHAASRIGNALAPGIIVLVMAAYGWRTSFFACAVLSLLWVAAWVLSFHEDPARHPRITPGELTQLTPLARARPHTVPWKRLAWRIAPVTAVYFCYGWTLWLFLGWLPQYFLHSYDLDLKSSALFASSVFAAGVAGDSAGGLLTDRIYRRTGNLVLARSRMVALCLFLGFLSLLPLMLFHTAGVALASLAAGFFFAEMTIGPMWAVPMDIAPDFSGTASGLMNTGSALAAIVSPVVSGFVIDRTGNWTLPFLGSMILMLTGMALTALMRPQRRFEA